MKPITPEQLRCLNTIVSKFKIAKDDKEMMVLGFSGGRATSSKDLWFDEASAMIKHLKANDPNAASVQRMKGKILYLAHEMGWYVENSKRNSKGKLQLDLQRIDNWCLKYGYIKRKFDNYSYEELPKLVTQFHDYVYQDYLKKI